MIVCLSQMPRNPHPCSKGWPHEHIKHECVRAASGVLWDKTHTVPRCIITITITIAITITITMTIGITITIDASEERVEEVLRELHMHKACIIQRTAS